MSHQFDAGWGKRGAGRLIMPVGTVLSYAGSTAPAGFLFCYGQNVSRTTYAKLYAAIGTTYGSGDGSTTFGLPDLRGRVIAGLDNMGGSSANRLTSPINGDNIGATGGAESHTLATAEMPVHNHGVTDPQHAHGFSRSLQGVTGSSLTGGGTTPHYYSAGSDTLGGTNYVATGISINNAGSGSAHNNMQPTIVMPKIIYTGV